MIEISNYKSLDENTVNHVPVLQTGMLFEKSDNINKREFEFQTPTTTSSYNFSSPEITQIPEFESTIITARQMLENKYDEIPSLIEPIFPKVGIVGLVGSSDVNKSTFLRQLAFCVAYGESHFLDYKINATHNRVIYVSTEDDEASIGRLLKIQFGMPEHLEKTERLKYIFETDDLKNTLEQEITRNPVDLIIIDAFADLYTGDLNANNKVRGFLNEYRELAIKHKLLIIFLHHTGKGKEYLAPNKNNAIGSQGFEAKMRLLIEIRRDPKESDIRHLCIVKGNYLPDEYKTHSIVTRVNDHMLFENLNRQVPFWQLAVSKDKNEAKERAIELRTTENKTYREIEEQLKSEGLKAGKSTIQEWCKCLK